MNKVYHAADSKLQLSKQILMRSSQSIGDRFQQLINRFLDSGDTIQNVESAWEWDICGYMIDDSAFVHWKNNTNKCDIFTWSKVFLWLIIRMYSTIVNAYDDTINILILVFVLPILSARIAIYIEFIWLSWLWLIRPLVLVSIRSFNCFRGNLSSDAFVICWFKRSVWSYCVSCVRYWAIVSVVSGSYEMMRMCQLWIDKKVFRKCKLK